MELKINVSLIDIVKHKLEVLGWKIEEKKENSRLYVVHSCSLIEDSIVESELVEYMKNNNLDTFDSKEFNDVSNIILNKHILNEDSKHTIKNAEEVFR